MDSSVYVMKFMKGLSDGITMFSEVSCHYELFVGG